MKESQQPEPTREQLVLPLESTEQVDQGVDPYKKELTAVDFDITKDPRWHLAVEGLRQARQASRKKQDH